MNGMSAERLRILGTAVVLVALGGSCGSQPAGAPQVTVPATSGATTTSQPSVGADDLPGVVV